MHELPGKHMAIIVSDKNAIVGLNRNDYMGM